jgi:hypothetical protein
MLAAKGVLPSPVRKLFPTPPFPPATGMRIALDMA